MSEAETGKHPWHRGGQCMVMGGHILCTANVYTACSAEYADSNCVAGGRTNKDRDGEGGCEWVVMLLLLL